MNGPSDDVAAQLVVSARRPFLVALVAGVLGGIIGSLLALLLGGGWSDDGVDRADLDAAVADAVLAAGVADANPGAATALVVQRAAPSVVLVDRSGVGLTAAGQGSGVVLSPGLVVTNAHVIGGAVDLGVVTADGRRLEATVVGSDAASDLAVLAVDDLSLPSLELATALPDLGDPVVALGSPFGLAGTVTAGVISAVDRPVDVRTSEGVTRLPSVLQTDAEVNPGSSGGPLLDLSGRVVGITSAVLAGGEGEDAVGIAFALPASLVQRVLDSIVADGVVRRPSLGVTAETLDHAAAAAAGIAGAISGGVLVQQVREGSAAATAGLVPGEIILSVGATEVRDVDDLLAEIHSAGAGATIDLRVLSDGRTRTVSVVLDDSAAAGESED